MTEQDLLEAAAKAAGLLLVFDPDAPVSGHSPRVDGGRYWNPLTDDGDALRLAVKLELEIRVFNGKAHAGKQGRFWCTENWFPEGGVYAATRRAIVRAAASLAKETP